MSEALKREYGKEAPQKERVFSFGYYNDNLRGNLKGGNSMEIHINLRDYDNYVINLRG